MKSQTRFSEFNDRFFPARENYKPEKGQILARFRASADFVDGWVKRNVIDLLLANKDGAELARRVMGKVVQCVERDAVRVLREMAEDLVSMTAAEVLAKPYRFVLEQFYWTRREYVPDDPHWDLIELTDMTGGGKMKEINL